MKRSGRKLQVVMHVLREYAGKSQTQLGEEIHSDRNAVGRIESGADVHPTVLIDWVDACGGVSAIDNLIDSLQRIRELVTTLRRDYLAYA